MIADLQALWQEAFGDSQETLDKFFATGFSPDRYHCICQDGRPVCALYRLDCEVNGKSFAYLYAMATLKSHRGKGLARRLLGETHEILKNQGYAGAILVPGEPSLYGFYEKTGYRTVTTVREFSCVAAAEPVALQEVVAAEYARLRKMMLPPGGVVQEGETLSYLATYAKLYKGEDFLLSATKEGENLLVHEMLGNANCCGNILCALACKTGRFRTPGTGRKFAMYLPFTADCPQPTYFGLALD